MSEEHKEKIRQAHLRNNAKREFSQAHKDALSTAQRARWAAEREERLRPIDWEQIERDKKLCSP
jgi:hypothetical protein